MRNYFGVNFLSLKIEELNDQYLHGESLVFDEGFQQALHLFHKAAERVPAYKDFLAKNNINHESIKTLDDFKKVPVVNKKNYLSQYPLKSLCWDGGFKSLYILSTSSGSTGAPFLWPRGELQELEGAVTFELIFKKFFEIDKYKTLYINCFAMGTWISGPFVLACAEYLTKKGYHVLTVTPSVEKEIVFSLLKELAGQFDQIVLSGYPPFIKDVVDQADLHGIDLKAHRIRFLFAAEGFSEYWREYMHEKVGQPKDSLTTSINMYGSADAAILAHETPVTTAIRKLLTLSQEAHKKIFSESRMPTLTQYDPRAKFFECINEGELIFTSGSGIPLIRYSIGDTGGIYSYREMEEKLSEFKWNLGDHVHNEDLKWRLPFVYVFGRSDLTISFYGLLIFPEHIKYSLEHSDFTSVITGKFVISTEFDAKQNQVLTI